MKALLPVYMASAVMTFTITFEGEKGTFTDREK